MRFPAVRVATPVLSLVLAASLAAPMASLTPAIAQEQQAGNPASTNADETFKKLIAKCDNTDVLVLRARIRLQLGHTTPEAAKDAKAMLDKGLSTCGEGNIDEAKATLAKALKLAEAGVTKTYGQDASTKVTTAASKPDQKAKPGDDAAKPDATPAAEQKPWWKFW
ncbi:MAG: hypothetical protein AAFR04_10085 [Pseudomonadota bacterium]